MATPQNQGQKMNEQQIRIVEKIQKLLALANSSNEHESQLAAEKAQALLIKYNLTAEEVDLDPNEDKYVKEVITTDTSKLSPEWKHIYQLLVEFYFVRIVLGRAPVKDESGHYVRTANGRRIRYEVYYTIVGKPHNVKIALHVQSFLERSFKELFDAYSKETKSRSLQARNSFYVGLYKGLSQQLRSNVKVVEQETGLIVVPDAGLKAALHDIFGKLSNSKSSSKIGSVEAMQAGVAQGRNLRIAKGLDDRGSGALSPAALQLKGRTT
jgi:hypothetical protein